MSVSLGSSQTYFLGQLPARKEKHKCNIILSTPLDHLYSAKQEGLLILFFQMCIILQTIIHPDTQRKLEWGTKVFCSSMNSMKNRSSSTNQPFLEQTSLNMTWKMS